MKGEGAMLLILEIMLTIAAWKRGWKALALIPVGLAFLVGLLIAGSVEPGTDVSEIMPLALIGDGLAIVALVIMSLTGRRVAAA
jgi:hypothetical protein